MKSKKINKIKLKIVKCDTEEIWYHDKIGKSFFFYDYVFLDDAKPHRRKSIWKSTNKIKGDITEPMLNKDLGYDKYLVWDLHFYAFIEDTDYHIKERKKKIKKINKVVRSKK